MFEQAPQFMLDWVASGAPVEVAFLPALIGAVGAIGGTLLSSRSQSRANDKNAALTREQFYKTRKWNVADNRAQRAYARRVLQDNRRYSQKVTRQQRRYDERRAREQAASRGIDFQKLRDQAEEAGFNPLSALGMAGAYSTEIGGGGFSGGGPAGGAPMGVASVQSGGFSAMGSAGAPYQPTISSATAQFLANHMSHFAEAIIRDRGEGDPLADALRSAMDEKQVQQTVKAANPYQDFGFSLTKSQSQGADVTATAPPLSGGRIQQADAAGPQVDARGRPPRNPFDRNRPEVPVRRVNGQSITVDKTVADRLGINAWDQLSAGDEAEIFGEISEADNAVGYIGGEQYPDRPSKTPSVFTQDWTVSKQFEGSLPKIPPWLKGLINNGVTYHGPRLHSGETRWGGFQAR